MTHPINNTPLVALNDLARSYWNDHVSYLGNDDEMAEWVAADRNDVLDVKALIVAGLHKELKEKSIALTPILVKVSSWQ